MSTIYERLTERERALGLDLQRAALRELEECLEVIPQPQTGAPYREKWRDPFGCDEDTEDDNTEPSWVGEGRRIVPSGDDTIASFEAPTLAVARRDPNDVDPQDKRYSYMLGLGAILAGYVNTKSLIPKRDELDNFSHRLGKEDRWKPEGKEVSYYDILSTMLWVQDFYVVSARKNPQLYLGYPEFLNFLRTFDTHATRVLLDAPGSAPFLLHSVASDIANHCDRGEIPYAAAQLEGLALCLAKAEEISPPTYRNLFAVAKDYVRRGCEKDPLLRDVFAMKRTYAVEVSRLSTAYNAVDTVAGLEAAEQQMRRVSWSLSRLVPTPPLSQEILPEQHVPMWKRWYVGYSLGEKRYKRERQEDIRRVAERRMDYLRVLRIVAERADTIFFGERCVDRYLVVQSKRFT